MNVAFIPVRGGSKSIPLKNIKNFCGKPLVYWTVKAASECDSIDKVFVSTDSKEISDVVNGLKLPKVEVIGRSLETATDTASTESALLEFAESRSFDNIVLIQATSPLLKSSDLQKGFELFNEPSIDSVMSVVRQKRFNWKYVGDYIQPINYDVFNRPRRQEFEGYLVENGAFYITKRTALLESRNRVSGNIKAVEMPESTYFEIDEPSDWVIMEQLLKQELAGAKKTEMKIEMFLTDCDGCLTDSGMYYSEHGDELKKFCSYDGMGFSLLRKNGIKTGIITGESVELNQRRADKLKLDIVEKGCKDKAEALTRISKEYGIPFENIAYMGDDINDLDAMKIAGYTFAPANAVQSIKEISDYVCEKNGGSGAFREAVDFILSGKV